VDEPLTTIEPVTAPPPEGLSPALAAGLLAPGAALEAGAVVAPLPPLHALATSAAANARVATRFDALIPTMVVLLFGRGLGGGMPVRLLWNVSRANRRGAR